MATHATQDSNIYRGLGHDVAGPEVQDFVTFVKRQIRSSMNTSMA
ncbi:hypothetical protein QMK19_34725 [Streptomyces sp. H10-C2]|nr:MULTISPECIES: hypothetical protein [unclassified Streptomyces]MDJ0345751.1 hypothetical protein [Streptomyces sp. PH10-H1]MDJ0374641.1 hypothetical protein [Streptomyces sp. H10-C2]